MHIAPEKLPAMISVVIPAFNEECALEEAVFAVTSELAKYSAMEWEVLIVDDGSQDRTLQIGQKLALNPQIRICRHESNRGKGAAVRTGVLQSSGDAVLIMDADLSTHPRMLGLFITALADGADLVTGDRRSPETRIERPQALLRRIMGGVYAAMARLATGASLRDFNCGFKLMRGDVARSLLAQCRSDQWVWDVEVIALAIRHKYAVEAIPVTWRQGERTSVKPFRAAVASITELAKLWINLRRKNIPENSSTYRHKTFWTLTIIILFAAAVITSDKHGRSGRKYAQDNTSHKIQHPEEAFFIWQNKNVHGRTLILFDSYPHNMGYYSYNGKPGLTQTNLIEYSIFQNIIRRIYFIVPESDWDEFRKQKFIRPIREATEIAKGLYLYNQSGIPIIATPPSSLPELEEKALVYINDRIFASDQALALLARKKISSDIVVTYERVPK